MRHNGWGFNTKDIDPKVRPQDDFFHFASGGWIQRNPIPPEENRWGAFTVLRKETDRELKALVQEVSKTKRVTHGSAEQMIRDLYRSGMDMATRRKKGLSPIAPLIERIRSIRTADDIVPAIARLERCGVSGVWGMGVDQDERNSEKYVIYLAQNGLGMPDRDYYLKDDAESRRVRDAYLAYLIRLLELSGERGAREQAETILEFETELAEASMRKEDTRDVDKTYHKMTLGQLAKIAPGIDWAGYFKIAGASPRSVVVMQPKFFTAVARMLRNHPVETWKAYLFANVVSDYSSYLTPALEQASFEFYGTVLSGMKVMRPLWRRVLRSVNGSLSELVGRLYVERHFPKEAKKKIVAIVDDLFLAYGTRIKSLDWMSAATKKKALVKLAAMKRKLGYPDKWKSYKGLVIRPDDYAGNIMRVSEYEHRRAMRRLGKPVDRAEWFMSPQTVNAYFSFLMNEVVFPAAILQAPFFDANGDDALNYGAIGAVIGHEITHGFDDQGSKFDGKGNRKTWWTAEDRRRFTKKAQVLVRQFNAYEIEPGIHVNGKLTLGENIADLGGISIAFDAYTARLQKTGWQIIDGFTPEQRFFLGYALFEREQERPEYRKMQAMSDPHTSSEFRVNGPFSNLPEFYEAWGVKKGDKLYREPKDRARIW